MTHFRTIVALTLFAAVLVPASAASVAVTGITPTLGGAQVTKRTVVNYDDLNLADRAGVAALYDRINHAAEMLCTSNRGGTGMLLADKVRQCRITAVRRAVNDIGSPQLNAAAGLN